MKRFTRLVWSAATLLCVWSCPTHGRAQQGWSEGEWNEPTFTLKRVCQSNEANEIYELAVVEGRKRKVGVLGPQPGDHSAPSAKLELPNGLSAYLTMRLDAPASFGARGGAEITCLVKVTVTAPATFKRPIKANFKLSTPICSDDLNSVEVEVAPGMTVTRQLRGGVRIVHKKWDAKFETSGPGWNWVPIPIRRAVSDAQARFRAESVNATSFTTGKLTALKTDISEQFCVSGYIAGSRMNQEVMCIYEGVATKRGASSPPTPTTPPTPPPPPPPVHQPIPIECGFHRDRFQLRPKRFERLHDLGQIVGQSFAHQRRAAGVLDGAVNISCMQVQPCE